jgi:GNAT superfamily N-acetyltransferase
MYSYDSNYNNFKNMLTTDFQMLNAPWNEATQATLLELYEAIFATPPSAHMLDRLAHRHDFLLILAKDRVTGKATGFKLGFRDSPDTYYSWLGGVLPAARGQGLARRMMEYQHEWAAARGYTYIRTNTLNQWRAMLILNLQAGFDIIGTERRHDGEVKILLEKKL